MNTTMNFHESYPILDVDQNRILANNGNIVYAYRVELPEIYSLSESDFEELHGHWFQALKSLPIGTLVHKQDIYRKTSYDAGRLPSDTYLAKATRDHFEGREHLSHECLIFFIWPKNRAINSSALINPFAKVSKKLPEKLGEGAEEFGKSVRDTVGFLNNSTKLKLLPFNQAAMIQYTDAYFNGFNEGFDTDMVLEKKKVQVGEHWFGAMAVNNEACFGDTVQTSRPNPHYTADGFLFHQGFIDGCGLAFPGNHIVNQIIHLDDRHKWRKQLEKRLEELSKSSNFGSRNKMLYDRVSDTLSKLNQDDSASIIRGQLNVLCWAKDQQRLDRSLSELTACFKELDIKPYCPVGKSRIHYMLNSYPMFSSNFADTDLYVTDLKHALCLWINSTNYRSDKKGIIFNDRLENIPVVKDVWDEEKRRIKARNFAIFAPTGEGKSFLANNILRQYFEQNVRLVIIDLGGSYAKFAQLYANQHIILKYEPGKNLGINPFYKTPGEAVTAEWLEDLTNFLIELYVPGEGSNKAQEVALKKILRSYYERVKKGHCLDGLYRYVQDNRVNLLEELDIDSSYFNLTNFLHILSEYVGDGLYSFLFKAGEDQSHRLEDKRLIVFELDEVRDNREVLSVMLKLIKSAIQRTIWQNRSEQGIILFDEFAKQLKFDNVLESVEFYYQAIRKQNGAIGIVLQSINQLPENHTSATILENTQVIYSLRNEKGYGALRDRLNLTSHDVDQLRSIKNDLKGERKYTEIFIKIGSESNIYRLEVPPEAYAAYLTDGSENQTIMNLFEKTHDMELAIKAFINQKEQKNENK
ncbi:TraG family conjugative transposon ATPase [Muricauda oceani]|uniref:TraG family conjugative transposon ATPase n=1 Tax=Flagellimonas oceani TaxID=2698672 RepID=A0A6G7J798_9FLAO|nr:TraG family conjugative transposon ATPase [Allomuricauda oceani]MBW8242553.1 TraG family conjugative transposon ATPase [Allomuricauda oceani]QII46312.1 TraG family conjugative transposon ATPase [Allomuricauda oceani]